MFHKLKRCNRFLLLGILLLLAFSSMSVRAEAGWQKNKNGTYSYYSNGALVKSKWVENDYYVNSKGVRQTGWLYSGGKWYYFNKSTGKVLRNKWISSGKSKYYASSTGALYVSGCYKIGDGYFGFNKRGVMLVGKQTFGDKTYFFGKKTGMMQTKIWVSISKKYYYFDANGVMSKNKWIGRYYVNKNGQRVTSSWQDGRYLGSDGKCLTGLQKVSGTYYYFDTKTYKKVTNTTVMVGGKKYKFDSNGKGTQVKTSNGAPSTKVSVEATYYTDKVVDDTTLLASIIYCEAGNQPYTGKLAVGYVIMNRVHSPSCPNKLMEVIYQKTQFTPARDGSLTRTLNGNYNAAAFAECKKAATEIMTAMKSYKAGDKVYLTIDGKKTDFTSYLFFMTPAAYKRLGLSATKLVIQDHVFFKTWK